MPEWTFPVHGAYMIPFYAMWAQRYMHEFKVTSEDLAQVAVIDRYHATLNPDSVMGHRGEITVDDVLNSRIIAEPLHLFDCSLDNDGGLRGRPRPPPSGPATARSRPCTCWAAPRRCSPTST